MGSGDDAKGMPGRRQLTIVAPGGWTNPSARVRALAWTERVHPLDLHTSTYLDTPDVRAGTLLRHGARIPGVEKRLRAMAHGARLGTLLLQREASPLSTGEVERRLLDHAAHGVFDIDDALYLPRGGLSPRRALQSHRKAALLASSADVVIAGSGTIADWADPLAERVVQIPSCIDLKDYLPKQDYEIADTATVLWIGSRTSEHYLRSLAPVLAALARKVPTRLLLIGEARGRLPDGLAPLTDRRTWSSAAVRRAVAEADVGIMPLPDEPFARGKCAYKLLQYAAAGLPIVGSPVGASGHFLHAAGAPTPTSAGEWMAALRDVLTASATKRRQLGADARSVVSQRFTYDVWREEWCDAVFPSR